MTAQLAILISAVTAACGLGLLIILWLRGRQKKDARYQIKPFLTPAQENFFASLCAAAPGCHIFPNVPVSALLETVNGHTKPNAAQRKRIQCRNLDFALYDSQFKLLCVIELSNRFNDSEQDARFERYFKSAGIKLLRWDVESKPSIEQIHRYIASLTGMDGALPSAHQGPETRMITTPDTVMARDNAPITRTGTGLSLSKLEQLTPHKKIRIKHPHIWEKLCMFAVDPRQLQAYLNSLLIQDRGQERAGFSYGVLTELSNIRAENDRFLTPAGATWQRATMRV